MCLQELVDLNNDNMNIQTDEGNDDPEIKYNRYDGADGDGLRKRKQNTADVELVNSAGPAGAPAYTNTEVNSDHELNKRSEDSGEELLLQPKKVSHFSSSLICNFCCVAESTPSKLLATPSPDVSLTQTVPSLCRRKCRSATAAVAGAAGSSPKK